MIYKYLLLLTSLFTIVFSEHANPTTTFINEPIKSVHHQHTYWLMEDYFNAPHAYGGVTATIELLKTFRPERITQSLFGDATLYNKQCIVISGSQTDDRHNNPITITHHASCDNDHTKKDNCDIGTQDWLADYFMLPTDYKSVVSFQPRVDTLAIHVHASLDTHKLIPHTHLELHIPLQKTTWDLHMEEHTQERGTNNHAPGYFTPQEITRDSLATSFTSFIDGKALPSIEGLTFIPLRDSRMSVHSLHETKVAAVNIAGFWKCYTSKRAVLNAEFLWSIPTGTKPNGKHLFEPIVGNAHHTECGGGLISNVQLSHNDEYNRSFSWYTHTYLAHLFSTKEKRSFDLKNKQNSRYMLAHKLTNDVENNLQGNGVTANTQFDDVITPVANLTTFETSIKIPILFEFTTFFTLYQDSYSWTFGYRYHARSCDSLRILDTCPQLTKEQWALKGDAHLYGFIAQESMGDELSLNTPIALSATQSRATISTGRNMPQDGSTDAAVIADAQKNPRIDNAQPATAGNDQVLSAQPDGMVANHINTSIQPRIISFNDIDINSALTTERSHTVFAYIQKRWEKTDITPIVGIGAELTLGRDAKKTTIKECSKCINAALSSWHFYGKLGITFG